jgi:hypothetical protein
MAVYHDDHVGTIAICDYGGVPVWTERRWVGWWVTDGVTRRFAPTRELAEAMVTAWVGPLRRVG